MEALKKILSNYIPEQAVEYCVRLWEESPFRFKVTRKRLTKLGDYRYYPKTKRHGITVNHDLNPYAFLITYIHEIAHLRTFEQYGRKVRPHGAEWKHTFKHLALPLLNDAIFPPDVLRKLANYLKNPKASSCADHELMRVLSLHNNQDTTFLEDVPLGKMFSFSNRKFEKISLQRTRYICKEIKTGKRYLISKSAEVAV